MDRPAAFQPNPDDDWPLTPRTRYYVWAALTITVDELKNDLLRMLEDRSTDLDAAMQLNVFPPGMTSQSIEWWVEFLRHGDRLTNAVAVGRSMTPRTPGEEAILYVALTNEVPVLRDLKWINEKKKFKKLPRVEDDYQFDSVLGTLAGDTDIELVFDRSMDGIGDPDDPTHQTLGMADLRLSAWNEEFNRGHWSDE